MARGVKRRVEQEKKNQEKKRDREKVQKGV